MLERGGGGGLAEPVAGTDSDLYRAVSRRSLKRSAAMRALDSSCSGMLLMSEEKGLSGFSRLISQLVFPGEGRSLPSGYRPHASSQPPPPAPHWAARYAILKGMCQGCRAPRAQARSGIEGKKQALRKACPWLCPAAQGNAWLGVTYLSDKHSAAPGQAQEASQSSKLLPRGLGPAREASGLCPPHKAQGPCSALTFLTEHPHIPRLT